MHAPVGLRGHPPCGKPGFNEKEREGLDLSPKLASERKGWTHNFREKLQMESLSHDPTRLWPRGAVRPLLLPSALMALPSSMARGAAAPPATGLAPSATTPNPSARK